MWWASHQPSQLNAHFIGSCKAQETEIRVDLAEGKVAVPVRVGFATPIPALSKVSVKIDWVYAPAVYDANGNVLNNTNTRYAEYGVLTGVTVNGVTYKVESDSVH
jgi:hypothetical protein